MPGGYVYVTRQLMGIINDEAELAFVVGHETGHIAANHHQRRRSAQRSTIWGVLGSSWARRSATMRSADFPGCPAILQGASAEL